jgi:hypothetical protein
MTKKTVILSGIYYPLAILRYFEAALRRRDDINLITVGPYTGNMIPWNNWMTLASKYAIPPTITLPIGQPFVPISFIENQLPLLTENQIAALKNEIVVLEKRVKVNPDLENQIAALKNEIVVLENRSEPDLWIQIDAGFYLEGRPQNGKNAIVATDPHVLNYDRQRTFADTFYCMQDCYKKPGDEYLPYAYDPIWHAPEEQERLFDVCLLGLHYANRNLLVNRLMQNGVKVYYHLGDVFDEARAIYNQAPIGINWSSKDDLTARVFELLGMRRLAVVNNVTDLPRFFEGGKDLVTFNTLEEATEKILYYLANEDQLQAIADQGHKTVGPHTWDARIEQILEDA